MLRMADPDDMDVDEVYPTQNTYSNRFYSPFQSSQSFFDKDRFKKGNESSVTDLFGKIRLNGQEEEIEKANIEQQQDNNSVVPYHSSPPPSSPLLNSPPLSSSNSSPATMQSPHVQQNQQETSDSSFTQQLDTNHSIPPIPTTPIARNGEQQQPYIVLHQTHDHLNESHGTIYYLFGLVKVTFIGCIGILIVYSASYFVKSFKHDVGIKIAGYESDSMEEVFYCQRQYDLNNCDPETRLPGIIELCRDWERCMYRSVSVSHSRVIAETVADMANGFVETITLKTLLSVIMITWTFLYFLPNRS